jgi:hypothetical protein
MIIWRVGSPETLRRQGMRILRFSGLEPSLPVRLQHKPQSPLDELVVSVMREGFMILAITSVPLYCRVSLDKPKMMKEAKGFASETEAHTSRSRMVSTGSICCWPIAGVFKNYFRQLEKS